MLEWLAGVQSVDAETATPNDETVGCIDDAPNTPAPLFAARAFKQLIWGTPQPEEMQRLREQPRRRTSRANAKASDMSTQRGISTDNPALPSVRTPTKSDMKRPGILLTPGTGGTRRKTVSFERKPYNYQNGAILALQPSATPREVLAKSPSQDVSKMENKPSKVPIEATNTAAPLLRQSKSVVAHVNEDITLDMTAPRSISGNYWKREYDSFSAKSAAELRKLAKKEQVAKKYAKSKDSEATKLSQMLRNEETKVLQLQKQVDNYVAQLSSIVKRNSDEVAGSLKNVPDRSNMKVMKDEGIFAEDVTHASPPRSSTRQLESTLTNAIATIESLKATNASLEAEVSRLKSDREFQQGEIERYKDSNDANSNTPRSSSKRRLRKAINVHESVVVSDIWADMGNDVAEPIRPTRRVDRSMEKVTLMPKSLNLADKERLNGKESVLSIERREAAKKRLEERRRNREKEAGVMQ